MKQLTPEIETSFRHYLCGEIQMVEVRKKHDLTYFTAGELLNQFLIKKYNPVPANQLYLQRMAEVEFDRLSNYTKEEIETQLF